MQFSSSYLAGLFDGEGCIFIAVQRKGLKIPHYVLSCSICMTHRQTIEQLCQQFNRRMTIHKIDLKKPHCQRAYEIVWSSDAARDFLLLVKDNLFIKKEQAELALLFQEHMNRYRGQLSRKPHIEVEPFSNYRENIRLLMQAYKKGWFLGASYWNDGEFGGHPMPGQELTRKGNTELSRG